jgi:serpin B
VAEDLTLKSVYGAIISNFYNTSLEKVNFATPKETSDLINNFVKEKTNGIIPQVFDEESLDPLSKLVIVNAIYFKGDWLFKFDEEKTEPMEFHVDDERKVDYPFGMKLIEALRMAYIEELGADVLEMPYQVITNHTLLILLFFTFIE